MSDFPLILTEAAAAKAKEALLENEQGSFIRVAIQGGGCSGLQYKLDIETEQYDGDYLHEEEGLKMVCDGHSALVLQGSTLDYVSSFAGQGFVFVNPNAKKTCGCGNSFGY